MDGQAGLSSIWDWMQNSGVMDALRRRPDPVYLEPNPNPPSLANRPAPAAGRSGSISAPTRHGMWERGKVLKREEEAEAAAKEAARWKYAGQAVKAAADFQEEPERREPVPGMMTKPAGAPGYQGSGLSPARLQAIISGQPSIISALFGGYVPRGR